MQSDVLIIGGGIGGAVLAELLGRAGKRVLVLERGIAPPAWVRPEILWPRTVQTLSSLAPRSDWLEDSMVPLSGLMVFDGREVVSLLTRETLESYGMAPWSTNPNALRERLLRLRAFDVHRGVEVTSILRDESRVIGVRARNLETGESYERLAKVIVGDDGIHSGLREALGIRLDMHTFPVDFLCFGARFPSALGSNVGRVWMHTNKDGESEGILGTLLLPLPNERAAGVVIVRPEIFDDVEAAREVWAGFLDIDRDLAGLFLDLTFPDDFLRVQRPWGHAEAYGRDGAFLLGDAAHPVSPVGGQGANMAVADARVLAQLILHLEQGIGLAYEDRRRRANERSLWFTRLASVILSPPGLPHEITRFTVGSLSRHKFLLRMLLRTASTAFRERSEGPRVAA